MLTGQNKAEKKQRLQEMRFTLKQHRVKFKNESIHIQKAYRKLMAKLTKENG